MNLSFMLLYCWFVQKKETGQALLDKVFKYLELHERDYFGLQFASVVPNISDAVVSTIYLTDNISFVWYSKYL